MTREPLHPWHQQPHEPDKYFRLFELYRKMGPGRSQTRLVGLLRGVNGGVQAGGNLIKVSATWRWVQRAEAWDLAQAQQIQEDEHNRQMSSRAQRLDIIDQLLNAVSTVMLTADIGSMGRYEARAWFPAMRLLLRDLLQAQRAELGLPAAAPAGDAGAVETFRADEFAAASKELAGWAASQGRDDSALESLDANLRGELRNLLTDLYTEAGQAQVSKSESTSARKRKGDAHESQQPKTPDA